MQNIARWAILAPLFLIPFLALYIEGSLFFPFISGKNFAFRVLVEIALAGYIVLALADRRYRPRFSWAMASFALLVVWMAVADSFAMNAHKAFWSNFERMDGFVTLAHVFLLFLIAGSVLTVDKLWRTWWMTFIAATTLVCGYGLLQLFGLAQIHQSGTRLDATLGNSEYFAGYLLLALAVTLWQAFAAKRGWLRYSLFALAAIEVLLLLGTGTRGTFVALIGAAIFGGLLWLIELGAKGRKGAALFLVVVIVLVGGFYALRDSSFIQNNANLSRFASISVSQLGTRFTIWGMAIEGVKERPITGWGHEGFNYVFNTYYEPSLYGQEPWFDRAHNIYLDWLIVGGIPALLLFLLLGGSAVVAVYRSRELAAWERVLILSAFAAYSIQGLAVFDNLFTYVPIALLLAYAHTLRSRPIPAFERAREVKGAALDTVIAPVTLITALLLIYMVNVPTYAAGKDIIKGLTPGGSVEARLAHFKRALERDPFATQEIREQLLQFSQSAVTTPGVSEEAKMQAVAYARTQIEEEIRRAPNDARLYALYGSYLRTIGFYEDARTVLAHAHELSPHKQNIIIEQGIAAWQAEDAAAARTFFEEAYGLSPSSDDPVIYAAIGHIITGDVPGGKALLQERFGTTTVGNAALAFAYQRAGATDDLIAVLRARYLAQNDAMSGYQLAVTLAEVGRIAEAREQTRAVMSAHPESATQGAQLLVQLGVR